MVEKELAREVRYDSLFLGYELGMSRESFFKHSWQLNKKKLVKEGPGNNSVEYKLKELPHDARMYFYPNFYQDRVFQMPVNITYNGWAPWNEELGSDSLLVDVLDWLKDTYGKGFIIMEETEKNGPVYVKIDGNRKITVVKNGDASVTVVFTDLLLEKKVEQQMNS